MGDIILLPHFLILGEMLQKLYRYSPDVNCHLQIKEISWHVECLQVLPSVAVPGVGRGGGIFFCLSAERSVMAMVILPLLHYENVCLTFFEVGKQMCTPPPPIPLSDFFRAGAKFVASRSSSESFCPPPLSKHPGAAPGYL